MKTKTTKTPKATTPVLSAAQRSSATTAKKKAAAAAAVPAIASKPSSEVKRPVKPAATKPAVPAPKRAAKSEVVPCSKCGRINRNPANHPDCFSPKACAGRVAAAAAVPAQA